MNRRGFLRGLIGGVAAAAAVREFPFRVFSFPSELTIINPDVPIASTFNGLGDPTFDQLSAATLADLRQEILYDNFFVDTPFIKLLRSKGEIGVIASPGFQVPLTFDKVLRELTLAERIEDELWSVNREITKALSHPE